MLFVDVNSYIENMHSPQWLFATLSITPFYVIYYVIYVNCCIIAMIDITFNAMRQIDVFVVCNMQW